MSETAARLIEAETARRANASTCSLGLSDVRDLVSAIRGLPGNVVGSNAAEVSAAAYGITSVDGPIRQIMQQPFGQ